MCQQPLTCRKLSFCHLCQVVGVIVFPYYWSCLRVHLCRQLGDTGIPPSSLFIIIILPPVWSAIPYSLGTQLGLMVFLGKIGADHKCKETKIMGIVVFLGKVEDDVCFFGLLERKMMAGSVFSSFLLVTNESIWNFLVLTDFSF